MSLPVNGEYQIASPTRRFPIGIIKRIVDHLREPLFWNGYALILSSMATSLLGLVYWGVAARTYNPETVGINTAAMSGLQLLSLISQLGMVNVANRFVPTAGKTTASLVLVAYVIAITAAFLSAMIFVGGINIWTPSLSFIQTNPVLAACFIVSTMGWVIFVIQDAVLVGLRQATWVPVENIVFAIAKIALLAVFVALIPEYGIFASWVIPSVLIVIPTNILIFRYLIPRHVRNTAAHSTVVRAGDIFRFITGNYLSTLIWNATVSIIPLIVFAKVGAVSSAYFYLPWTIAFALHLVSTGFNMSFLTEVASDTGKLAHYSIRTWSQTILLLIPAVIVIEVGAPYILQIFGGAYAAGGATLLRLLTLSTIGYSFTAHFIEITRARQHNKDAFIVQAVLCFLIVSLGYVFLGAWGITGLGIAWFIAQMSVGSFLAVTKLGKMWLPELKRSELGRMSSVTRNLLWKWTHRSINAEALRLIPQILTVIADTKAIPEARLWTRYTIIPTTSDMTVVSIGPSEGLAECILKLPRTPTAENSYLKQKHLLSEIREDPRLFEFSRLLPVIITDGKIDGHRYSLEQVLTGVSADQFIKDRHRDKEVCASMLKLATQEIRMLHIRTSRPIRVNSDMIARWVDERIAVIDKLYMTASPGFVSSSAVKRLQRELHTCLEGMQTQVSWVHGDYWLGNIRVSPDGQTLTGILDWEQAAQDEIPQCDLISFIVTTRSFATNSELGDVVTQLLDHEDWTVAEKAILDQASQDFTIDPIDTRTLLLLTWLRHVSDGITKMPQRRSHWFWTYRNIESVVSKL